MMRILCVFCALALCLGCSSRSADFEIRKRPVTAPSATAMMRAAKKSPPGPITRAEYVEARSAAIESFVDAARGENAEWRSLARTLDEVTPLESKNQAVPVRVVRAPFSSRTSWIIVQNWGKPNTPLSHAKVWAIGVKDGALLYAASEL